MENIQSHKTESKRITLPVPLWAEIKEQSTRKEIDTDTCIQDLILSGLEEEFYKGAIEETPEDAGISKEHIEDFRETVKRIQEGKEKTFTFEEAEREIFSK